MSDRRWEAIKPHLPNKPARRWSTPAGSERPFSWALRSDARQADLPSATDRIAVYNRLNRWRKVGPWARLVDAIVEAHDGDAQLIGASIVRVRLQGVGDHFTISLT